MNAPRACWTVLAQKAQDQVSLVQAEMAQGRARLLSLQASRERLQKLYEDYQKPAVGSDASGGMQETMNQRQFSSQLLTLMERVQQDLAQTEAALKVSLSAESGRTYRLQPVPIARLEGPGQVLHRGRRWTHGVSEVV